MHANSLFFLPVSKGRWLLVLLNILLYLCLGTVYSWSVFRADFEKLYMVKSMQSLLPFTVFLTFYAVSMPLAGWFIAKYDPRLLSILGIMVMSLGYILSGMSVHIWQFILAYGVLAGSGVGITYGVPLALVAKWFPDRKGLATGLSMAGFGLSPLVTAPVSELLLLHYGLSKTFIILGVVFFVLCSFISLLFRYPTQEQAQVFAAQTSHKVLSAPSTPAWHSQQFYILWFCFFFGTFLGLSAIGISSSVGQELVRLDPYKASLAVSLFAIANALGRPLFGYLVDMLGAKWAAVLDFLIFFIALFLLMNVHTQPLAFYLIGFFLCWLGLGGWLAIAPTTTLRLFGEKNYSKNYGFLFTAYGAGALLGTLSAGFLRDTFGNYTEFFYAASFVACVGVFLSLLLREAKLT